MSIAISIREWWQWSYAQICTFLYFDRVTLVGEASVPEGPVLFLGIHRNGILDALVYSNVLGRMTFVLAKRLHKTLPGRILFGGIGVVRDKDDATRDGNRKALKLCRTYLAHGRHIFMFPEGTSSLGPRLLEIKPGAAKIALSALRARPDLKVIPVAVSYERAWGFRSRAEVRPGSPIDLADILLQPKSERFAMVQQRIEAALHEIASEFETETAQEASEIAGNVGRAAGAGSHSTCVKACAVETTPQLEERWQSLKRASEAAGAKRYNRVPLVPGGSIHTHTLTLIGLGPWVAFMLAANVPVLIAARLLAARLADDRNVISLYRLLVGLPLMILWGGLTLVAFVWLGQPWIWAISLSLSLIGLGSYDTVKRSWTVLWNRTRSAQFQPEFEAFMRAVGVNPAFV